MVAPRVTDGLKYHGRPPKNCFEIEAARVHATQPARFEIVFLAPASERKRRKHEQTWGDREEAYILRWGRFQRLLAAKYPAVAETTILYHDFAFFLAWLCGFNPYAAGVSRWWAQFPFKVKFRMIQLSRAIGRDQLGRRRMLRQAMSEGTNLQNPASRCIG
jgi:hypothetical protein